MQQEDFNWYVENYGDLCAKYGNCFLAIKDKQVLGVYSSYAEGVHKTCEVEPLGTFIIQECNGDESGYTAYITTTFFEEE